MTVSIPLVAIIAVVAFICYRFLGLKGWHLLVCLLLGFLLAATTAAPGISRFLTWVIQYWGRK